ALDANGGVFNVGTGIETSVVDLYTVVRGVAGVDEDAVYAEPRPGEIHRSVLDVSRAERELGWRPEHDLHAGLTETWAWLGSASLRCPTRRATLPRDSRRVLGRRGGHAHLVSD